MNRTRTIGLSLAAALLAACGPDRTPTSPAERPGFTILDGAHPVSGLEHNEDFFFLPPLVPNPSGSQSFEASGFNGMWRPFLAVEIWHLTSGTPDALVTTFGPSAIQLSLTDEHYQVNWNTGSPGFDVGHAYRIRVVLAGTELGLADVALASTGNAARSLTTNEEIGLVDGRTLPIKFRIQDNVLTSADDEGTPAPADYVEQIVPNVNPDAPTTVVLTSTSYAGAEFPNGWTPINPATGQQYESLVVTIGRVAVDPSNQCQQTTIALIQAEGCYRYQTFPAEGVFGRPVTVGMCVELPTSTPNYDDYQLYKSDDDEPLTPLANVPWTHGSCDGFAGTPVGPTALSGRGLMDRLGDALLVLGSRLGELASPKPAYAVDLGIGGLAVDGFSYIGWGLSIDGAKIAATDAQLGLAGAALSQNIEVLVTNLPHHAEDPDHPQPIHPMTGIPVTFTVTGGGGSLGAAVMTVPTDAKGIASARWTLGNTLGVSQTVTASLGSVKTPSLTFTATAPARRYASRAEFVAALGDAGQETQTFESLAFGTPVTTIIDGVLDVSSPFETLEVFSSATRVLFGHDDVTRQVGTGRYELTFTQSRNAIAFDITAQNPAAGQATVEVHLASGRVVFAAPNLSGSESTPTFVGIIANQPITRVVIREGPEVTGTGNEETGLDNFIVSSVPNP